MFRVMELRTFMVKSSGWFSLLPFGVFLVARSLFPLRFGDLLCFGDQVGAVRIADPDMVAIQVGYQWLYFGNSTLADGKQLSELTHN
jgi:hypothetical protein